VVEWRGSGGRISVDRKGRVLDATLFDHAPKFRDPRTRFTACVESVRRMTRLVGALRASKHRTGAGRGGDAALGINKSRARRDVRESSS
jgi:hypothetical protein